MCPHPHSTLPPFPVLISPSSLGNQASTSPHTASRGRQAIFLGPTVSACCLWPCCVLLVSPVSTRLHVILSPHLSCTPPSSSPTNPCPVILFPLHPIHQCRSRTVTGHGPTDLTSCESWTTVTGHGLTDLTSWESWTTVTGHGPMDLTSCES